MPDVGTLTINLVAKTASFTPAMKKASDDAKTAAGDIRSSFNRMDFTEARGSIALLGEDIGVRLPRHLQTFLAGLPGVAPLMASAFSAVAVITLVSKIAEAIEKSEAHKEKLAQQAEAAKAANENLAKHAETLRISNLRLEDNIRALQKKPSVNGLVVAYEEAKQKVDELIREIQKAERENAKLLEEKAQGSLGRIFGSSGPEKFLNQLQADQVFHNQRLASIDEDRQRARADHDSSYEAFLNSLYAEEETNWSKHLDKMQADLDQRKKDFASVLAVPLKQSHIPALSDAKAQEHANEVFKEGQNVLNSLRIGASAAKDAFQDLGTQAELTAKKTGIEGAKAAFDEQLKAANEEWQGEKKLLDDKTKATEAFNREQVAEGKMSAGDAAKYTQEALDQQYSAEVAHDEKLKTILAAHPAELKKVIAEEESLLFAHDAKILEDYTKTLGQEKRLMEELEKKQAEFYSKEESEENRTTNQILKGIENRNRTWMAGIDAITSGEQKKIAALEKEIDDLRKIEDQQRRLGQTTELTDRAIVVLEKQRLELIYQEMAASTRFTTAFKGQMLELAAQWQQVGSQLASVTTKTFQGMNSSVANFIVTGQGGFRQLAAGAVEEIIKIGLQWVESKIMMLTFGKIAGTSELMTQAALAGAGGVASMAAAPFPMDLTAPAFGAAMMANALSYMALLSAAGGAMLPNAEALVHTHPNEMILPSPISKFILDSMASGRGSGRSGGHTINFAPHTSFHGMGESDDLSSLSDRAAKTSRADLKRMINKLSH